MANYTINNLPNVLESVADSDKLPIWDSSANRTAQISRSNLLGISQNKVIAISGTTVTGAELETNAILRLFFTAEVAGSDGTTPMTISYNGTSYTVKVAKNGSLTDFVAREISSGTFKYLQAYTTLELLYNGTQFVIVGNPIVLSSSDYTIYADGKIEGGLIGEIKPFGGTTIPYGFHLCDGTLLSRTDYSELFAVIGTSFGVGDGSTTFAIPNLRGEFLRGAGTNSHSNQGSGGSVGSHQDATIVDVVTRHDNQLRKSNDGAFSSHNYDFYKIAPGYNLLLGGEYVDSGSQGYYTVRPTNTSVNFIIKIK